MIDAERRRLLGALAGGGALLLGGCGRDGGRPRVVDVAQLDATEVAAIARPASTAALQQLLQGNARTLSVGGARYSMGGQIAAPGSLHLDMRAMDRLVWLDVARRRVRVQAGMRWRALQQLIDPHELAVAIMQSYSNFSIGGSVSVNCHGRYLHAGPLVNSIRALQLVDAGGQVHELDREREPALFAAVVGGYGGLGVITEVELDLADNQRLERVARQLPLADYPAYFATEIVGDPLAVMHNADLLPPHFDRPLAITWRRSEAALTEPLRLVPPQLDYARDQNLIWAASELPLGGLIREHYLTERILHEPAVVHRNYQASLDARSLEPRTRMLSTYLLQEYFVPVDALLPFARTMAAILQRHQVHALNISIRHSPADPTTLLRWAAVPVVSFVLYHKQRNSHAADRVAAGWTRELIDAALAHGGRYYLPYRRHASQRQFEAAYPEAARFAALRRALDPQRRFHNRLWDTYLPS